ncbi:MAG: histidine phosphatase family protein [Acidobacteriota bacterium]
MRKRSGRLLLVLPLAFLPAAARAQKAVFVVRHAEKASDANDPGVPLSESGTARARRLAAMLKDAGVTAIYSTDYVRTRATAAPLAESLRLPIRIYAAKDSEGRPSATALIETLRKEPQAVALVVGHGDTVPALLSALGVSQKIELADREFDNLFLVVPRTSGGPILLRLRY